MPLPSIISLTPSSGPTAGGLLVEVRGDGFPVGPALPPAAQVVIGSRAAGDVRVLAPDRLTCLIPSGDPGPADVAVQLLDATGRTIDGALAIAPRAFTYVRQLLSVEADLTRLVRALLQELKRQVIENVVLTVHTDFDTETGAELHLATIGRLPALVLVGPELAESRFYATNQRQELPAGPGQFAVRRAPYTVDLGFTVVGVADHTTELLNLLAATQLFFHRNRYLELARDPHDAEVGSVRYEMDVARDAGFRVTSQPNESNVRSFSGRVIVRGFDLESLAGVPGDGVVEIGAVVERVELQPIEQVGSPAEDGIVHR